MEDCLTDFCRFSHGCLDIVPVSNRSKTKREREGYFLQGFWSVNCRVLLPTRLTRLLRYVCGASNSHQIQMQTASRDQVICSTPWIARVFFYSEERSVMMEDILFSDVAGAGLAEQC